MADNRKKSSEKKPRGNGKPFQKNNPETGEKDPRINRAGAPIRGKSYMERVNDLSDMTNEELADFFGRTSAIGRQFLLQPRDVVSRDGVIGRALLTMQNDFDPRGFEKVIDRAEGKPAQTIITRSGGEEGHTLTTIPAELLTSDFLQVNRDILAGKHTEYTFDGGRGSLKSTFISEMIITLLTMNPNMHALVLRQVAADIRESVYSQLKWSIETLGLSAKFEAKLSPLGITYLPTGQQIFFRGANDPSSIKSIKPPFGYIGILWLEELDQFHGEASVRSIVQSALRGGEKSYRFESWNTPRTKNNWVNKYIAAPKAERMHTRSNYLNVPAEWLGQTFLMEAEHLRNTNPAAYDHEYMGVSNSDGGMIFENIIQRAITDAEIAQFDNVLRGGDWGFSPDPFSYGAMHFDAARRVLYIFDEYRDWKKSNRQTYDYLVKHKNLQPDDLIILDSAESKSVSDYREYGANARAAEKGKESRKYSYRWLQGLTSIIIDPKRAPYHAQEFSSAEYPRTKDGEIISEYPSKDDHAIDDTRYATNLIWRRQGQ